MIDLERSALHTDLYQLTMLEAYFRHGLTDTAVFELSVRRLPPERGFLVAAGLEQLVAWLEGLRFTAEELAWVRESGHFGPDFADRLAALRFTGDVDAVPEGTVLFAGEPMVRITAPMPEAQLVETRLINLLHFQTLIASKAARCVLAAPGRTLVDFGLRRAHGAEAGLLAARASYLAGFAGSSAVLAAPRFGIPVYGTMAHSFIEAHASESQAFERFARVQTGNVTLLIDTYDTEEGARAVARLAPRLRESGIAVRGVRIDSGDLADHARRVRRILDEADLGEVRIFASGNLDEYALRALLAAGAPIDAFGVGTRMDTSTDAPSLDFIYKLQEYAGRPRRKRSEGKATWPGRKQLHRRSGPGGTMAGDVVTVVGDPQEGEALIRPVMRQGRRVEPPEPLDAARERAAAELARLPPHLRDLQEAPAYPVAVAPALRELASAVDRDLGARGP